MPGGRGHRRGLGAVLAWLDQRRAPTQAPTRPACHYLLQHLSSRPFADRDRVAAVLAERWALLEPHQVTGWLVQVWPALAGDRPVTDLPTGVDPQEWARSPLLTADVPRPHRPT